MQPSTSSGSSVLDKRDRNFLAVYPVTARVAFCQETPSHVFSKSRFATTVLSCCIVRTDILVATTTPRMPNHLCPLSCQFDYCGRCRAQVLARKSLRGMRTSIHFSVCVRFFCYENQTNIWLLRFSSTCVIPISLLYIPCSTWIISIIHINCPALLCA